jgi:hypothetical protein
MFVLSLPTYKWHACNGYVYRYKPQCSYIENNNGLIDSYIENNHSLIDERFHRFLRGFQGLFVIRVQLQYAGYGRRYAGS